MFSFDLPTVSRPNLHVPIQRISRWVSTALINNASATHWTIDSEKLPRLEGTRSHEIEREKDEKRKRYGTRDNSLLIYYNMFVLSAYHHVADEGGEFTFPCWYVSCICSPFLPPSSVVADMQFFLIHTFIASFLPLLRRIETLSIELNSLSSIELYRIRFWLISKRSTFENGTINAVTLLVLFLSEIG